MKNTSKQVMLCEHCSNNSPQDIIFETKGPTESFKHTSEDYESEYTVYYFLTKCGSCSEISLFTDWDLDHQPGDLSYSILVYPHIRELGESVPETILIDYQEANKVLKKSPIAFVVLARRALESICADQKAKGRTLKEKIDDLAKKDIIPKSLARMANAIRQLGNIGAHPSDKIIDPYEARILNDFIAAIIEYVYIAPAKLDDLAEKLKKKKK